MERKTKTGRASGEHSWGGGRKEVLRGRGAGRQLVPADCSIKKGRARPDSVQLKRRKIGGQLRQEWSRGPEKARELS